LRTKFYVDGFNLYYGALRKTPHRWVNLESLFQFLLPKNTIQEIKHFTALVSARPNDPSQQQRLQLYLRALATLSKVSVLLGPIKIVRNELGKKVGILNPQKNPSRAILPHIDFIKQIRSGALGASQFPATMQYAAGQFTKPAGW